MYEVMQSKLSLIQHSVSIAQVNYKKETRAKIVDMIYDLHGMPKDEKAEQQKEEAQIKFIQDHQNIRWDKLFSIDSSFEEHNREAEAREGSIYSAFQSDKQQMII